MRRILFIIAATVILSGLFYLLAQQGTAQGKMKSALHHAGFKKPAITNAVKQKDGYSFQGITLDSNEFSTIENATLRSYKDERGTTLTLDKMVLTGDWRNGTIPEISGWQAPSSLRVLADGLRKNKINTLVLNSGQFDVITPFAGLIRLEAKGQMALMPDGAVRLQAVLWSVQKQLKAEIHINGEFAKNGIASIDFEVADGKLALNALEASRLGGWLILNKNAASSPWAISAQLVAGAAKAYNLALNGLTLSAQGHLQDAQLTLQAGGNHGTALAIDAQLKANGTDKITATLRADNASSLLHILSGSGTAASLAADNKRPGAIVFYEAEAKTMRQLPDQAKIDIGDLSGQLWMNSTLRKTAHGAELDIQQVKLQELSHALGLMQLSANGTLTGLMPLRRDEQGHILIDQGLLRATQPGYLSLNPATLPPSFKTERQDALSLLSAFSYNNLEILLAGPLPGEIEGDISLTGKPGTALDQKTTRINFLFKGKLADD